MERNLSRTWHGPAKELNRNEKKVLSKRGNRERFVSPAEWKITAVFSFLLSQLPIVPCASLLVRIVPAPKNTQGLPLSMADVPSEEWASSGLQVPAPDYSTGVYLSQQAYPTAQECMIYQALVQRAAIKVRDALDMASDGKQRRMPTDKTKLHWIRR